MTEIEQLISKVEQHGRLLRKLVKQSQEPEWMSENKIKSEFNIGKKFLQKQRAEGKITYRSVNGRNFQYQRSEIESLFTTIKQ